MVECHPALATSRYKHEAWTFRLVFNGKPEALKAYWRGIWDGLFNKAIKAE